MAVITRVRITAGAFFMLRFIASRVSSCRLAPALRFFSDVLFFPAGMMNRKYNAVNEDYKSLSKDEMQDLFYTRCRSHF